MKTLRIPFRLWMTGSLAVVMASLCTGRGVLDAERLAGSMRVLRHSPYGVKETLRRIEAAAEARGLQVLARVGQQGSVVVLASTVGGTPVLMQSEDSPPDVPLAVQVLRSNDGGAEVLVPQSLDSGWYGMPAPVADELAELPDLLGRALT
ncbi:hypothetical protein [Piscinibacter sp.]|uniref:hypothetical protein n=1 Tax=Piscinibacter sp. TaxID=1903157 RepID=UPI0039E565E6